MNKRYKVSFTEKIQEHIRTSIEREANAIFNVYELPNIEQAVPYLHAAAGFPTKRTWLKAKVWRGNYKTWSLLNVKNVHTHFLESEETQKGHMRSQQGVR